MDSRPEWSADGKVLVFIRDSGSSLDIVSLDLETGKERVLVDVEAINLQEYFGSKLEYWGGIGFGISGSELFLDAGLGENLYERYSVPLL